MLKLDERVDVLRKSFGKISFVVCKSNNGLFQFEIPTNYTMEHILNILKDYNNNDRTLILKALDKDVMRKYIDIVRLRDK